MPNPTFFIDDSFFEGLSLSKGGLGLYAAEASVLRTELKRSLQDSSSIENWNFLNDIKQINSQKTATVEEINQKLSHLFDKFISSNAPEQVNLSGKISSAIERNYMEMVLAPADFLTAINMVFTDSILPNIKPEDSRIFQSAEKMIRAVNAITQDLTVVMQATQGESKIRFLDSISPPSEMQHVKATNDAAKTAQQALFSLLNQANTTHDEFKASSGQILGQFTQITDAAVAAIEKLPNRNDNRLNNMKDSLKAIDSKRVAAGIDLTSTPVNTLNRKR
jgi:hypothetical protein